jgi:AGZA family xanthine/uracil permease-like MFS transporter
LHYPKPSKYYIKKFKETFLMQMKRFYKLFQINEKQTSISTEIISGITTFSSMAYVIMVHPLILNDMGLDFGAIMVATIFITKSITRWISLISPIDICSKFF